uniref:SAM domain-containing protein n=1 Tax=Amphora coffeiformis TaxID=265554 RepID=A0A7S3P2Z9_9STRA
MTTETLDVATFRAWKPQQFATYMRDTHNLGAYYEAIIGNDIGGDTAPQLTENDLKVGKIYACALWQMESPFRGQFAANQATLFSSHTCAPSLTTTTSQELGINSIGDRKRFIAALDELKKGSRKADREKILWQDTEVLFFSCYDRNCATCCGCCPVDPSEYKLTNHQYVPYQTYRSMCMHVMNSLPIIVAILPLVATPVSLVCMFVFFFLAINSLVIKTVMPSRCGPLRCCFGHEYHVDNIDLTYITSGDIKGEAAPCFQECCCCGNGRDRVNLMTSSEGGKYLVLKKGEGERVNRLILNQIEEAQKIERD